MKRILAMILGVSLAMSASADLLYFMAQSDSSQLFDFAMVGVAKQVDGQWVTAWGDGSSQVYLDIQSTSGGETSQFLASDDSRTVAGPAWADVTDYTSDGYRFYIEGYANDSDDPIWTYNESTAKTYAELLAAGSIYTGGMDVPNATVWNGVVSVPEPTSALLVLLGSALLALRRRRV